MVLYFPNSACLIWESFCHVLTLFLKGLTSTSSMIKHVFPFLRNHKFSSSGWSLLAEMRRIDVYSVMLFSDDLSFIHPLSIDCFNFP